MPVTIPDALTPVFQSPYPYRPRLLYVLRRKPDVSHEAFVQALSNWRRERDYSVQAGALVLHAGAAILEEQERINRQFSPGGIEVAPLDGYVSLDLECYEPTAADFETLFKAADGCLNSLAPVVDFAESIAFAGVANFAIPGFAPMSMLLILNRANGVSLKQYNAWWVRHGHDHRRINIGQAGYHQVHTAPEFNAIAAKAAGVATTEQCIVDHMYLGRLDAAFASGGHGSAEEAKAYWADINAHVSMATVSGSFFREV